MKSYSQKGYIHYIMMIGILINLLIIYYRSNGNVFDNYIHNFIISFSILIFLISILLFYQLSLTLEEEAIVLKLGIGLYSRKYYYHDIKSVKVTPLNSFPGLGIRYIGNGWRYNLTLDNAVELSFHHKSEIIQISMKQADEIVDDLNKIIKKK